MRIVYHLGAHCTDEERLVTCLWKNRAALATEGIVVPPPARYRALMRDTAMTLKGRPASRDTQALVLDQIMEEERAERLILGWDNFLSYPQWVVKDRLYPAAAERIRAFTQIFPEIEAEFHLSIRSLSSFLPALLVKQRGKSWQEFMGNVDPFSLGWAEVVEDILRMNPDAPFTIWCDEDTPLIWPEVLRAVAGHSPAVQLDGEDELLERLMLPEGLARMRDYLAGNPPAGVTQRRRVVSAFLDKFARPDQIEMEVDIPGWNAETVAVLDAAYRRDLARIAAMPGVTLLTA
jgi:hypothetical protein